MKKYMIIMSILVMSCGVDGDSTTPKPECIANDSSLSTVAKDSIRVTISQTGNSKPIKDAVVQLDNKGVCMLSNKDGVVTFNAISAGPHDIHVFPSSNYDWYSKYDVVGGENVNVGLSGIAERNMPSQVSSYVSLNGTLTKFTSGNELEFVFTTSAGDIITSTATINGTTYSTDFDLGGGVLANTKLSGEILALEYKPAKTTGTGERYLVNTAVIASSAFTSSATKANYTTKNITFAAPPTATTLLSFTRITLPVGFVKPTTGILGSYTQSGAVKQITLNSTTAKFNLTAPPIVFNSYQPFNFSKFSFTSYASRASTNSNSTSMLQGDFLKNATTTKLKFDSLLKIVPQFSQSQKGSQISWSTPGGTLTWQSLYIYDISWSQKSSRQWVVDMDIKATSIILPEIPRSIRPLLVRKTNYRTFLLGGISGSNIAEEFTVNSTRWTR